MNNEQLLKPRWKAIAAFPDNRNYEVGTILDRDWCRYVNDEDESEGIVWRISDFPHLFKKLKWWEERTEDEMPKFLKLFYNDKNKYVHKVEKWTGENSDGQPLYEYFNKVNYLSTACVSDLLPATEEDYNEYRSTFRLVE